MKVSHPISIDYTHIQVLFGTRWHICEYKGWEPITESDFRASIQEDDHIRYDAVPFNVNSGIAVEHPWKFIHESRVLPFKGTPTLKQKKKVYKKPVKWEK